MTLTPDPTLFPDEVVLGAAWQALGACFVHLERTAEGRIRVTLHPREEGAADVARLEGEFRNELLNQVMRLRVAEATRGERERILARAFASQEYDPFLTAADFADDPLGIAVPWEERFGEEAPAERLAPAPAPKAPRGGKAKAAKKGTGAAKAPARGKGKGGRK